MLQILKPSDLAQELTHLYTNGLPPGTSTGWRSVDQLYTVAPGYWTVITGIPSHGKSTWLDCLLLNLVEQGWKFIIYSPENQPNELHLANLCEKWLRQPFRANYNNRMTPTDLAGAMDVLEDSIQILRHDGGAIWPSLNTFMVTCDEILTNVWDDDSKVAVVLDPWMELDQTPVPGMSETNQINWSLSHYRQWIRRYEKRVHGFIVAHPAKPQKDKDGGFKDVTLYDINGSAAWKNKCDFGIIVRRDADNATTIVVEKCRWRHLGKHGSTLLTFNSGTGTYDDFETRNGSVRRYGEDGD